MLLARAPGQFSTILPVQASGEYSLVVSGRYGLERRRLLLDELREVAGPPDRATKSGRSLREHWTLASDATPRQLRSHRAPFPLRGILTATSLIAYVLVLTIGDRETSIIRRSGRATTRDQG